MAMQKRSMFSILTLMVSFIMASCSGGGDGSIVEVKAGSPQEVESISKTTSLLQIDTVASLVNWIGNKPGGSHTGTLKLQSGYLEYADQQLVGGRIVFNMSSIANTDISDSVSRIKLETHLKSPDFFNTVRFATSDLVITKVNFSDSNKSGECIVSGNLTIKGITKGIAFSSRVEVSGGQVTAHVGPISINRTDWGVNYGSKSIFDNLKDKFIDDNIEITVVLKTVK